MTPWREAGSLSGAATDSLVSTPARFFREDDLRYYDHPPNFDSDDSGFETEFYYKNWTRTSTGGATGWSFDDPVEIRDPVPGTAATLRARVVGGGIRVHAGYTNRIHLTMNGALLFERDFYNGSVTTLSSVINTATIPAGNLFDGTNTFTFRGWTFVGGTTDSTFGTTRFFFDWYEVEWERALRARNDLLVLSTENQAAGNVLARVRGFSQPGILLYDVTDALAGNVRRLGVDAAQVVNAGGSWDLRFDHDHATDPDGPGARTFVALEDGAARQVPAADIRSVGAPTLLAGGTGAQWVAVAWDDFVDGTDELAAHRSADYTTRVAPISEVWNVFGNGRIDPLALKAYAAYAYHRWETPIVFLLLVGDASEDHRGVGANADPDFVPSHSLYAVYEGAPEESDQYYAEVTRNESGTGWDDLSDLYVGRLPVGSVEELAWNVRRIREYETHQPDEDPSWRHRVILLADDQFSGSLGGGLGDPYGWVSNEGGFEDKSEEFAEMLSDHPLADLRPRRVYLSEFSHPCPDSCYSIADADCEAGLGMDCGIWYDCRDFPDWNDQYFCERTRVRPLVLSHLLEEIRSGALLWNYQGHANKFFMTHEEVFRDDTFSGMTDVDAVDNPGLPFVLLGWACHLAEFDRADEASSEDCLAEKLMNERISGSPRPGGAVACFASSGFEFLTPNLEFNKLVFEAFFFPEVARDTTAHPEVIGLPTTGSGAVYDWTLGEATTRARLMFQSQYPTGRTRQAAQRFVLLGDPALEPDAGPPAFEVTIDGQPVEDSRDPFFVNGNNPSNVEFLVRARAVDSRGIDSWRVVDTARGVIPTDDYTAELGDVTDDGVARSVTIEYLIRIRPGETYDVAFEALGSGGRLSRFVFRVSSVFAFLDEPVAFPNPFRSRVDVLYKLTDFAEAVDASVFTLAGRRIAEIANGVRASNVQNRVTWDGRDGNGRPVANGTYLLQIKARNETGQLERVVPVVLLR
jgi:hypothetical protein